MALLIRALKDPYEELRPGTYDSHYILAASPAMLKREAELTTFLGALVKADADVAADPAAAAQAVSASLNGNVSTEALQGMWSDMQFGTILSPDLLDLLVDEGTWIVGQGAVRADVPTAESMAKFIAPGPLKAAAPDAVTLK